MVIILKIIDILLFFGVFIGLFYGSIALFLYFAKKKDKKDDEENM